MRKKFDQIFSLCLINFFLPLLFLTVASLLLIFCIFIVFVYDHKNPIYRSNRVGKNNKPFDFYKIRSMSIGQKFYKFNTTSKNDPRITPVGIVIRYLKIDEFLQFLNVLAGTVDMVGPRAQIVEEVKLYTKQELILVKFKPGITDFSSIIFFNLNDIMSEYSDPNVAYHQLIRPWKNRLALFYLKNKNWKIDLRIIFITMISLVSHKTSMRLLFHTLKNLKIKKIYLILTLRKVKFKPFHPLGMNRIITKEDIYQ